MSSREELARTYLDKRPGAAANVLESLSPEESAALLKELPARIAGPVLTSMYHHYAIRCMEYLPQDFKVKVIQQLPNQRGAALLRGLPVQQQEALLNQLAVHHASTIRFLLSFSINLVGAWTNPNIVTVDPGSTVIDARKSLQALEKINVHRLFVVNRESHLKGCLTVAGLLQAKDDVMIKDIAEPVPNILRARTSLSIAEQHKDWREYLEMPVTGRTDEFIGIISYKNLYRGIQELRTGQAEKQNSDDEELIYGLTDMYRIGIHGAWQTWMELLSIPVEDKEDNSEHITRHNRGS